MSYEFSYNYKDLYSYDVITTQWTPKDTLYIGLGVNSCSYFSHNNIGYTGLGQISSSTYANDFSIYTPESGWTALPTFPGPARHKANCFVIDDKAYVGGGYSSNAVYQDYYSLDLNTYTWTPVATFPNKVAGQFHFSASSFGYVGGGFNSGSINNNLYKFIPDGTGSWSFVTTYPGQARVNSWAIGGSGKGYVFGGMYFDGASTAQRLSEVLIYDTANNTWATGATIPGNGKSDIAGASVEVNNISNFIYYTGPSVAAYPYDCNLWSIKVDNYGNSYSPTRVSRIPILTSSYWTIPTAVTSAWSGTKNNWCYPMDIAATPTYVLVTQWFWKETFLGRPAPSGNNVLHLGLRTAPDSANIATWYTQILDTADNAPKGMTIYVNKFKPDQLFINCINGRNTYHATISNNELIIPSITADKWSDSELTNMYNAPKDLEANKSVSIPIATSMFLYLRGKNYLKYVSKANPAEHMLYNTEEDTTSKNNEIYPYIYWRD